MCCFAASCRSATGSASEARPRSSSSPAETLETSWTSVRRPPTSSSVARRSWASSSQPRPTARKTEPVETPENGDSPQLPGEPGAPGGQRPRSRVEPRRRGQKTHRKRRRPDRSPADGSRPQQAGSGGQSSRIAPSAPLSFARRTTPSAPTPQLCSR